MERFTKLLRRIAPALALAVALPLVASSSNAAAPKPKLEMVNGADLKKAIARHQGKVVLVNLWATWCAPCVKEFPDLVKLDKNLRGKGLVVIGVSMDEVRDSAKVDAFLTKQEAAFPVYMRAGGSVDDFFSPVAQDWPGAVPTTYVFDRKGKKIGKPLVGERTYAQFEAAVKPLL